MTKKLSRKDFDKYVKAMVEKGMLIDNGEAVGLTQDFLIQMRDCIKLTGVPSQGIVLAIMGRFRTLSKEDLAEIYRIVERMIWMQAEIEGIDKP